MAEAGVIELTVNDPGLLKIREVANILALSRPAVYKLVKDHAFPVVRIGKRSCRVKRDDLDAYIERKTIPTA